MMNLTLLRFGAFALLVKKARKETYGCAIIFFLLAGCAALDTHQAKLDQKQLRDVLMDYSEEQILDNLIRASNGLPIVHYDFSNITAQVTSKVIPTTGGGRTVNDVRTRTPTHNIVTTGQTTSSPAGQTVVNTVAKTFSVVGGLVETVAKPFNWGVSAERDNAISVQADPLLDEPDVYAAYIKFLNTDVVADDEARSIRSGPAVGDKNETEVTKTTTTTATPTTITTNTTSTEPIGAASPAQTRTGSAGTTTETKEFAETSSTTEENTRKPKSHKVDLVIKDFSGIRSLERSTTAPLGGDVLVGPKLWKDGNYYWVPKHYRRQFFALCLATVARGAGASGDGPTEKESDAVKALKESNAILRRQELR